MNFWNKQGLAVLKLEFIAENYHHQKHSNFHPHPPSERYSEYLGHNKSRPWVAMIKGYDEKFGIAREFVRGQIDYSQSNSVGSRGVYLYYALKPGIYEVNERSTWSKVRRFFVRVEGAAYEEISKEEVEQWLNETTKTNQ